MDWQISKRSRHEALVASRKRYAQDHQEESPETLPMVKWIMMLAECRCEPECRSVSCRSKSRKMVDSRKPVYSPLGSSGAKAIAEAIRAKRETNWKVFMVILLLVSNQSDNKKGVVKGGAQVRVLAGDRPWYVEVEPPIF